MDSRPPWKPIGVYRIVPLPILPVPPLPKKVVYKMMAPLSPRKSKRLRQVHFIETYPQG